MMHITVALPDDVAQEYYTASEKLKEYLGQGPDPQTLMRFILAGSTTDQIVLQFDRTLRNITGAPIPEESDTWVFSSQFEDAP